MASETEQQPTVEQSSYFSARSKDGRTIEFETLVKIFIKPPLDDTWDLEYLGSKEEPQFNVEGEEIKQKPDYSPSEATKTTPSSEKPQTHSTDKDENMSGVKNVPPSSLNVPGYEIGTKLDDFSPTTPEVLPLTHFIPDPCEAINNLENSVKNLFSKMFGSKHPTETPQTQDQPLNVTTID